MTVTAVPPEPDPPERGLTAIAAVAENGVIGDGQRLLWHLPEDFGRFKKVTLGGVLIMGRATFDSLGGALPGRQSIVLTRDASWGAPGALPVGSVAAALQRLTDFPDRRWWCIGGGQIYRALWPYTTDLDLTEVHQRPDGTVTFPAVDPAEWLETSRTPRSGFDFVTLTRRRRDAHDRLLTALARR